MSIVSLLASPIQNPTMLPTSGQYCDDGTYEPYRQHYAQMSADPYQQQQQTEQQLLHLSLSKFEQMNC